MPGYGYIALLVGWILWMLPFLRARRKTGQIQAQSVDRRARWGIALVAVSFFIVTRGRFWERPLLPWQFAAGSLFLLLAAVLSWTGVRALGRQWRIDAGLNSDHALVTAGPYRVVRHPIYTSMLCLLCGTGLMTTSPLWLAIAVAVFVTGTEIRIRIEEGLLESRFGEGFFDYRRRVSAYIPFLR